MQTSPTERSPGESADQLDISSRGREKVQELCEVVFGDDCGRLKNIRLGWQVPHPEAGREGEREGWRVYKCDVVGMGFAVPHGAPIPMLLADEVGTGTDDEPVSIAYRYVHPDLIRDRERLLDRLVRHVREEIRDNLASLSTSFNFLAALRDMDEVPDGSSPSPYRPVSEGTRVGYEPVDEERPLDEGER